MDSFGHGEARRAVPQTLCTRFDAFRARRRSAAGSTTAHVQSASIIPASFGAESGELATLCSEDWSQWDSHDTCSSLSMPGRTIRSPLLIDIGLPSSTSTWVLHRRGSRPFERAASAPTEVLESSRPSTRLAQRNTGASFDENVVPLWKRFETRRVRTRLYKPSLSTIPEEQD